MRPYDVSQTDKRPIEKIISPQEARRIGVAAVAESTYKSLHGLQIRPGFPIEGESIFVEIFDDIIEEIRSNERFADVESFMGEIVNAILAEGLSETIRLFKKIVGSNEDVINYFKIISADKDAVERMVDKPVHLDTLALLYTYHVLSLEE